MTRANKGILLGAWALIAAAGAAGLWKIARIPDLDPETERLCRELRRRMNEGPVETPPEDPWLARVGRQWARFDALGAAPHPFAATLTPKEAPRAVDPLPVDVDVQLLAAEPTAAAGLDGVTLTWTLAKGTVALTHPERPREVPATGLRVERREQDAWTVVARLEAKATSWRDAGAKPRTSYAYRVILEAPEKARVAAQGALVADARTPSTRRVRLVGGDAKVAILRVEAYNRESRTWDGRTSTARPGEELWPGGWRLTGLRFKGFDLVAEAVDEDGRAVELTGRD